MVDSLLRCIEEVTGKAPDRERCATAANQILGLWRALGKPPFELLERDLCLVAKAARECDRRLFARDIRAEGWDDGVDRSRSVSTLVVQKRWDERLAEAKEWWDSTSGLKSRANPHNPAKHGMALPDDLKRRWCSHTGGWIDKNIWRPYEEGPPS